MKSQITQDFLDRYRKLPPEIRQEARRAYRLWRSNPENRALNFEKLKRFRDLYSVRVTRGYRVVGKLEGDMMTWFWIGSHADYDELLRKS